MVLQRSHVPTAEVHALLSNSRRRMAIQRLSPDNAVKVSELARAIAAQEANQQPPPASVRESVYASLHQTHLPKLHEAGVVVYDPDEKLVRARTEVREMTRHLYPCDPVGLPWDDHYRVLATVCLFGVVATVIGLPGVASIPVVAWATLGLAAVAVSTTYQLWQLRRAAT